MVKTGTATQHAGPAASLGPDRACTCWRLEQKAGQGCPKTGFGKSEGLTMLNSSVQFKARRAQLNKVATHSFSMLP